MLKKILTTSMAAASNSALILQSRFCGNVTPNISALVNNSLITPDHCFFITPISLPLLEYT